MLFNMVLYILMETMIEFEFYNLQSEYFLICVL